MNFDSIPQTKQRNTIVHRRKLGLRAWGGVGPKARRPEQREQHVLSFRNPSHRLGPQRMEQEKPGQNESGRKRSKQPSQREEQARSRPGVQEKIRGVKTRRPYRETSA